MTIDPRAGYKLSVIAETDEAFVDFAPYVASINLRGQVAFQAKLRRGGSGVFVGDGSSVQPITEPIDGPFAEITSHPEINNHEEACFYATLKTGESGVFFMRDRNATRLSTSAGPLGPTMNEHGMVAFRAPTASGTEGIGVAATRGSMAWTPDSPAAPGSGAMPVVKLIAEAGRMYQAFHGLPVIGGNGQVLFRADLPNGVQGIYLSDGARVMPVAQTGNEFTNLGAFATMNDERLVAFCAEQRGGRSGVFLIIPGGGMATVADGGAGFESFRGVVINNQGHVVFYATPSGGTLGIYTGEHPVQDRLLGIGSPLLGSVVREFALNPVSINDAGELAIRVVLEDGRQLIIRADRL